MPTCSERLPGQQTGQLALPRGSWTGMIHSGGDTGSRPPSATCFESISSEQKEACVWYAVLVEHKVHSICKILGNQLGTTSYRRRVYRLLNPAIESFFGAIIAR